MQPRPLEGSPTLEIEPEQFLVLFRPGTTSVRSRNIFCSGAGTEAFSLFLVKPPRRRGNYLNDGHFPPEMPRIDGRDSFSFE